MNKNKYIQSVLPSKKPKKYPKPLFPKKEDLEKALFKYGLKIKLNESLKGGFFSKVYGAIFNNKAVVVKYIDSIIPFDPTEFYIDKKQFNTDLKILAFFQKSKNVRVPKIILTLPKINIVILEDLRVSNFVLLNELILEKKLNFNSAEKIGKSLAFLLKESRKIKPFKTNESAEQSIYERGLELRLAYPNSQSQYLFLEKEFITHNQYLCWPDGHPKNIFVNNQGDCAFIDFGRSCFADQRYILPNFLAHIIIYCLIGYIKKDFVKEYFYQLIKTYKEIEPINESIFCQYLAMEIIHRAYGKWITGINTKEEKLTLIKFGLTIFDEKIMKINSLLNQLDCL